MSENDATVSEHPENTDSVFPAPPPSAEKDAGLNPFEKAYREAVGNTELAGEDYVAAIGSKDPERLRAAREAFGEAQRRESHALNELVVSRMPPNQVQVSFDRLLNDPTQQLDIHSEVLAAVYKNITADTACACTNPKCPRHYRPSAP